MKKHTTQEIINKVQAIFDGEHLKNCYMGWEPAGCIFVDKNTQEEVKITISCMYEAPGAASGDRSARTTG